MMRPSIARLEHMSQQELSMIADTYYDLCEKLTEHKLEIPDRVWDDLKLDIEAYYD
ncbi:hypothetical protein K9L97_05890 [Candidatus Woesearchaeota archaeon]|nr:hypothetical protein [Candidatus Woesearchaeota archaeon]